MTVLEQIIAKNRDYLRQPVIPLYPFLHTKARLMNDKPLKMALIVMGPPSNLVPNTAAWNERFETAGPYLTDALTPDGRRLLLDGDAAASEGEDS